MIQINNKNVNTLGGNFNISKPLGKEDIKVQEKNKFCCEEHIDMAFDDFINDNETFPDLEYVSDKECSYCSNKAKYMLILKSVTDDDR